MHQLAFQHTAHPTGQKMHEFAVAFVELAQVRLRRTEVDGAVALPIHHNQRADIAFQAERMIAGMSSISRMRHVRDGDDVVGGHGQRTIGRAQVEGLTVVQLHLGRRGVVLHRVALAFDMADDANRQPQIAPPKGQSFGQLLTAIDLRQSGDVVQRAQAFILVLQ